MLSIAYLRFSEPIKAFRFAIARLRWGSITETTPRRVLLSFTLTQYFLIVA